jgi:hypothetical protein
MTMLHVRPVNNARVLDPDNVPVPAPLPADGKTVADTPYWRRRLKAKEVELIPAPTVPKTKKQEK